MTTSKQDDFENDFVKHNKELGKFLKICFKECPDVYKKYKKFLQRETAEAIFFDLEKELRLNNETGCLDIIKEVKKKWIK